MAKQIKATDVFENEDIFKGIRESAEQAIATLGKFKKELAGTAEDLKKTIGGASMADTKGINELIAATTKANDVKEKTIKIDQEQEKLRRLAAQAEKEEIRVKKEMLTLAEKEQKAKDKEIRQAQQQESVYAQQSKRLNDLRKSYKDLAFQNKENTAEAQKLLAEITDLDAKLKKVDATVGQHQRNVGNYESATMSLRTELRKLTQELANMDEADPRFQQMAQRAGELRDRMQDTQGVIQATAGTAVENLAGSVANAGQIGVAAFQGMESAMVLMGIESENVMKAMLRLQALAGLGDALRTLGGLGDTLTQIRAGFVAAAQKLGILTAATQAQTAATVAQESATEGASVATNVLGKSMKALPIIAIVAGIATLVGLVYDYVTSSNSASEATKRRAEEERKANEETKKAAQYVAQESTQFVGLVMQLKNTNEGSKERSKLINQINSQYGTTLKNLKDETAFQAQLNQAVADYIEYAKAKYKMQKYEEAITRNLTFQGEINAKLRKELEELNRLEIIMNQNKFKRLSLEETLNLTAEQRIRKENEMKVLAESSRQDYEKQAKVVGSLKNQLENANERLENYGLAQVQLKDVTQQYNAVSEKTNETKTKEIKINEDLKKSLEDLRKANEENVFTQEVLLLIEKEANAERLKAEYKVSTDLKNRDAQLKEALLLNEQEYQRKIEALRGEKEIIKAETEVNKLKYKLTNASGLELIALRVQLKQAELNLLDKQEAEELRKAGKNEELKLKIQSDYALKRQQLEEEYAFKGEQVTKKEEKDLKKQAEIRNSWAKFTADYFIQQSNRKIEQIDKEIAAAEKQQDILQELAANGNINAQQSFAEQQKIIDNANRKKEQEQRRQQMIELVSGVYQTYNNKLAEGAEHPLMETIRDTVMLQQFANTLLGQMPTFLEGTEDTGTNGYGVDGKGGFHAILHPNERVVPKSLNEQIGSMSNEQLARIAQEYQNGKLIRGGQVGSAMDLAVLVNEMKDLKETIKQKPETNIELGEITTSVMEIVKKTKQGNTLKTNRYRIRK